MLRSGRLARPMGAVAADHGVAGLCSEEVLQMMLAPLAYV